MSNKRKNSLFWSMTPSLTILASGFAVSNSIDIRNLFYRIHCSYVTNKLTIVIRLHHNGSDRTADIWITEQLRLRAPPLSLILIRNKKIKLKCGFPEFLASLLKYAVLYQQLCFILEINNFFAVRWWVWHCFLWIVSIMWLKLPCKSKPATDI